ncbi:MAG TPA: acyl-ACP thioesterase domain-containing protein [Anaeromyxobacter sp.]|nr:acyl-ACP thioesterase domain-containing protein [Anaeromyxobacter sp.]
METLRERYTVHTFEVDAFGRLAVPALAGFLAETAGRHATALGVGLDSLMARGVTWVLVRQRLEILREIRLHQEVEVETWPSGIDRLAALRDFVVRGADGAELARATSQWYVLDLATRRPRPPQAVLDPGRFRLEGAPRALDFREGKLPAPERWDGEQRFQVRYADIDQNLHVNNGSYLSWALEAVPRALWESHSLSEVEVQYRAEALLGDAVLSRLLGGGPGEFIHGIAREGDGRELARLLTRWTAREG